MADLSIGAPECYRWDEFLERSKLEVPRSVDIWSLGSIYSEAAVWVVLGRDGLSDYRRKRKAETDRIYSFKDGGCFHDGAKVLDTVRNFHSKVRENIRKNDHVTELVLDMVSDMLVAANSRPPSHFLHAKSSRILQTAQERFKSPKLEPELFAVDPGEDRPKTPPELPPPAIQDVLTRERSASPDRMTDADSESPDTTTNFGSSPHTSPPGAGQTDRHGIHGHVPAGGNRQGAMHGEAGQYEDPFVERRPRQSTRSSAAYRQKPHDTTQPWHRSQTSTSSEPKVQSVPINGHSRQDTRVASSNQQVPNQPTTMSSPPRVAGPYELKREPTKDPPPRLTIEDASKWIRQKEGGASVAPLADNRFLNDLNRRDHVGQTIHY
jgi:hypothetical protein